MQYDALVGNIEENLPCVTCGYSLRGLPTDGACPECGTDVSRSLRGNHLSAVDPAWLRTIARGQRLLSIGLMTAVTGLVVMLLGGVAFVLIVGFRPGLPRIVEDSFTIGLGVVFVAVPIGMCIALIGIYFVTAQEGRDIERETMWSARNLARWSMLGAIITCIAAYSMHFVTVLGGMWMGLVLDLFFRSVFIVLLTVAGVTLLKRLEGLARRVPNDPLAKQIRSHWKLIRWAVPAAGMYLLILPRIGFVGGAGMMRGGGAMLLAPFACMGFIAVIGLLLGSIRLARTMRVCTKQLQGCLATAEDVARSSTGGTS